VQQMQNESNRRELEEEEFQPSDLELLTFRPLGSEQSVSVWDATSSQFHAYVSRYASGFKNVNTEIWAHADRLHFLNQLYPYCRDRWLVFPFSGREFKKGEN
jgi:hypothetical protein